MKIGKLWLVDFYFIAQWIIFGSTGTIFTVYQTHVMNKNGLLYNIFSFFPKYLKKTKKNKKNRTFLYFYWFAVSYNVISFVFSLINEKKKNLHSLIESFTHSSQLILQKLKYFDFMNLSDVKSHFVVLDSVDSDQTVCSVQFDFEDEKLQHLTAAVILYCIKCGWT